METHSPVTEGLVAPEWFDAALHGIAVCFEGAADVALRSSRLEPPGGLR
jgi:hypothetical protein